MSRDIRYRYGKDGQVTYVYGPDYTFDLKGMSDKDVNLLVGQLDKIVYGIDKPKNARID